MSESFDPYHVWLGIPPEEQPPHHYRLLGIRLFEDNPSVIGNAADQRMTHLRTVQTGKHSDDSQRLLNEVAMARVCLLNDEQKRAYDAAIREHIQPDSRPLSSQGGVPLNPELAEYLRQATPEVRVSVRSGSRAIPVERRMAVKWLALIAGGTVCLLAAIAVVGLLARRPRESVLVFDWPARDRTEARLAVDGVTLEFPPEGPLEYGCEPGSHEVRASRAGYKPYILQVRVAAGQREMIAANWKRLSSAAPRGGRRPDREDAPSTKSPSSPVAEIPSASASPPQTTGPSTREAAGAIADAANSADPASGVPSAPTAAPEDAAPDASGQTTSSTSSDAQSKPVAGDAPRPEEAASSETVMSEWIDALSMADVSLDRVKGTWTRGDDGISVEGAGMPRFMFPLAVEGSYDLEAKFTRNTSDDGVGFLLPAGAGNCLLGLSCWHGQAHLIAYVDRRDNDAILRPGTLVNATPHTVQVSVRIDGDQVEITSRLDGQPCCQWKGDSRRLSVWHDWSLPDWRCPGIGSAGNGLTVHEFRLRAVAGRGKIIPILEADQQGPIKVPAQGLRVGGAFHEVGPPGARLIGLRTFRDSSVRGVQPIYRTADGQESRGQLWGKEIGTENLEKASDGYAMGGMRVKARDAIVAYQLVFMRVVPDGLDPTASYAGPWIGEDAFLPPIPLSGEGQPILGVHGFSWDAVHAIGLLVARPEKQAVPRFLRLTEVEPLTQKVGGCDYLVNRGWGDWWPILPPSPRLCQEYLFAHAPSRLVYTIPKNARSFSTVGYCDTGIVSFKILVDGLSVFSSGQTRVAPVLLDLPGRSKQIELVVDDLGDKAWDRAFWLKPRFYRAAASKVPQLEADDKHVKLTLFPPFAATVGENTPMANAVPKGISPPVEVLDWVPCDEIILAHAPSKVVFAIPPGARRFSAVGYNILSGDVKYQVLADGKPLFVSPQAGIVPMQVGLPAGARQLELVVDDLGNTGYDVAFWCYPRLSW
jgi:hypothetical protein